MEQHAHGTDRSEELRKLILTCSTIEMTAVIDATLQRMEQLYPDDEIIYLCLPCNDDKERNRLIDAAASMMRKYKPNPHNK